jgi:2'-5' RNA ligase
MDRPGSGDSHERRLELVVVALPSEDDAVRKYSSEKEAHLTLLYLGESNVSPTELKQMVEYIAHASSQFTRFGLSVERRGVLGDQQADVLFFEKQWTKKIAEFRGHLLQNELINRLYNSTFQYPEWTPHLTMGYPDKPAKKDDREFGGFSWINFDRIALWTGDSTGPTFNLKSDDYDMEVAMSVDSQLAVKKVLAHYGVAGMKWGVRKKSRPSVPDGQVLVDRNKKGKLVTAGGKGYRPHPDASEKAVAQQIAKKSGLQALSNKEIQAAVNRMNLEQQFVRLSPQTKRQKAKKFVAETLLGVGKQQVTRVANDVATQQVAAVMARR